MKLAAFEALTAALRDARVRYLVAGGLAVNAHGYLLKERANRPRDLDDIEHLRMIAEENRRNEPNR